MTDDETDEATKERYADDPARIDEGHAEEGGEEDGGENAAEAEDDEKDDEDEEGDNDGYIMSHREADEADDLRDTMSSSSGAGHHEDDVDEVPAADEEPEASTRPKWQGQ